MKNQIFELDRQRYVRKKEIPIFHKLYRKLQVVKNPITRIIYKVLFKFFKELRCIELSEKTEIGPGLYLGHAYCITINPDAVLGKNINIHKGVTIGQENRGVRKGTPVIGDNVWIGVNVTIVGKIKIGNDVLIAPNSYVNCDIPDHSVVFENPCVIKHRIDATEGYIHGMV